MMLQPVINGFVRSAGVSLHSILRDPASRMDPRLVLLRFHREGICQCQVMQVLLCWRMSELDELKEKLGL